jgi:hypothetical protein
VDVARWLSAVSPWRKPTFATQTREHTVCGMAFTQSIFSVGMYELALCRRLYKSDEIKWVLLYSTRIHHKNSYDAEDRTWVGRPRSSLVRAALSTRLNPRPACRLT